jgi:hypothetical protein
MVPVERIELPTFGLQNRCSTAELNRRMKALRGGRNPQLIPPMFRPVEYQTCLQRARTPGAASARRLLLVEGDMEKLSYPACAAKADLQAANARRPLFPRRYEITSVRSTRVDNLAVDVGERSLDHDETTLRVFG